MTNTINIEDIIVAESLKIISNELVFANKVNRAYEDKFNLNVQDHRTGPTIRIQKPMRSTTRSTWTMSVQNAVEDATSLTIDTIKGQDLSFTDADLALLVPDMNLDLWTKRFLKPRITQLANDIDLDLFGKAIVTVPNLVGSAGTLPQTFKVIGDAKQKLSENLAPHDDRTAIFSAAAINGLTDALKGTFVREVSANSLLKGFISDLNGFENFESENVPFHVNGTYGTDTVVTQNSGSPQIGSSLVTTGWTGTHGVAKGDIFTIANVFMVNYATKQTMATLQQFVVTAAATNAAGTTTISIFPSIVTSGATQSVSAAPAINTALTFVGSSATSYRQNLLFHKDAFTIAFAKLQVPTSGVVKAASKTYDGFTMRYIRSYDIVNAQMLDRIDAYYGFAALYPQWACRMTE